MKSHSIMYASNSEAARRKATRKYRGTSRTAYSVKLARGSKRGNLKPFVVYTMKRKKR